MPIRLISRRLLQAIPLLLGVVVLNFALIQSVPGTFLDVMTAEQQVTDPALIERLRVTYGLDQPPAVQLLKYIGSVARLDFGYSYRHNLPDPPRTQPAPASADRGLLGQWMKSVARVWSVDAFARG